MRLCFDGVACCSADECGGPLDVVFVLDDSTSYMFEMKWELTKMFVQSVVQSLDVGQQATRVGMVTYSGVVTSFFHLDDYDDQDTILQAIDNMWGQEGGYTDLVSGKYILVYFYNVTD